MVAVEEPRSGGRGRVRSVLPLPSTTMNSYPLSPPPSSLKRGGLVSLRVEMYESPRETKESRHHHHRDIQDICSESPAASGAPTPASDTNKVENSRNARPSGKCEEELGSTVCSSSIKHSIGALGQQWQLPARRQPGSTSDEVIVAAASISSSHSPPGASAPPGRNEKEVDERKEVKEGATGETEREGEETCERSESAELAPREVHPDTSAGRADPWISTSSSPRQSVGCGTPKDRQHHCDGRRRQPREARSENLPSLLGRLLPRPCAPALSFRVAWRQNRSVSNRPLQDASSGSSITSRGGQHLGYCENQDRSGGDEAEAHETGRSSKNTLFRAEARDEHKACISPSVTSCGSFLASRELGAAACLPAAAEQPPRFYPVAITDINDRDVQSSGEVLRHEGASAPLQEPGLDQSIPPNRHSGDHVDKGKSKDQMDGPECPVQILILNKMAALWDRQLAPLEKSKRELEKENHQLKEKLRKHQAGDHTDTEELTREQANLAASAALQSEVSAVEKALNEALAREKEITSERDLLRNRVAELERANESLAEANRNLAEENQNLIAYRTTVLRATVSSTRRSDVISSVDGETTMASHPQSHRNSILRV